MLHRHFAVRPWSRWAPATAAATLVLAGLVLAPASAATVSSALFVGGTGTVTVSNVVYARSGGDLTLNVSTSSDTKCVDVSGAFADHQQSSTAKASWTFTFSAPTGDGTRAVTVSASPDVNPQNKCTGTTRSTQASFVADNTGPVVTGVVSPAPNAAGWNSTDANIIWSATDAGVGLASGPTPASASVSTNTVSTVTSAATDKLGNSATGAVTVRVDKLAPTISGSSADNPDGSTTVSFECSDSGGSGIASCLADGASVSTRTVTGPATVTGTAKDQAGNTTTATVHVPSPDRTSPTITHTLSPAPNAAGWNRTDVSVVFSCSDDVAVASCLADGTSSDTRIVTGETGGTSVGGTATDSSGNTAYDSTTVKIDRTAPTTSLSGAPSNLWTNGSVSLALSTSDNLSGVDTTYSSVDGGAALSGTSISLTGEGDHTVSYWSVDRAGNTEDAHTVHVRIDRTAPTIGHGFTPSGYHDGDWTNAEVTVTFSCADQGGSGVASCTDPVTKSAEGEHTVQGTATDGAGNTATDSALVRIDLTSPAITAAATGEKSGLGWYAHDVVVSYTCSDALSGIAHCPGGDVLGEGRDQSASATAVDVAGNTAGDGVSGIDVDETAPVLNATYSKAWHSDDVTVDWTCHDALSGVVGPDHAIVGPDRTWSTTVGGEGGDLSTTESCTDAAGNTTTTTADGIRIDRHAPTTSASYADAPASGWYTGGVQVTLDSADSLSGVDTTTYTVDEGTPQTYTGPFTVTGDGHHTVRFHSTDVAGNVEGEPASVELAIDRTAPTTHVINPISPANGWFVTSGIPFAFDATDNTDGSGVATTYYRIDGGDPQTYGEPFTTDLSDGTHTVTYWSVDAAGNDEKPGTFQINVDTVPPSIVGEQSPAPNGFGWNHTDVSVTFSCSDLTSGVQSGVAGCAGDTVLTNEGAGQTVTGDAVDNAGNKAGTTYGPVNIDTTPPTLVGVAEDANGAGWYNGDVTVDWQANDALSGIDPASLPDAGHVTGEGRGLTASATIRDRAGNVGQGSVTGLEIDRTAPTITGSATTAPNPAGWYHSGVTVDWHCTDPVLADGTDGSGVASCPTSSLLSQDGAGQTATSGHPTDVAGNTGAVATVSGINIDGTAPVTKVDNTCTQVDEWCTGETADVVLSANDNLSGVQEIHYRIDGGAEQVESGDSTTVSVPLSGSGAGTVTYWAVDVAGNAEKANQVALKWDNIAPTVTHVLDPTANALGWNNSPVTVTFSAMDDDKGSGVAHVSDPVTVSDETAGTDVTGTATDTAGNVGTDKVKVKVDKTAPTITGAITSGQLGTNGWYVGPVTVRFTCGDALAGVATCPDPVTLADNGAGQSASGTVTDRAGNTASASVTDVKIDQEKPTITGVNVDSGTYVLGQAPNATCTTTDSFSGPASCTVVVTGGTANGTGTFAWTATATDKAGNVTTRTGTYKVVYRFDGFLQPINDTAHQVGTSTSIFKAGSTVPVKLVLKDAAGNLVQPVKPPEWLTPVQGGKTSAPVDESVYSASADSGTAYRYDASAQQWIYNWKTPSGGGSYWRIGVTLDDGQTYYVNIGLR